MSRFSIVLLGLAVAGCTTTLTSVSSGQDSTIGSSRASTTIPSPPAPTSTTVEEHPSQTQSSAPDASDSATPETTAVEPPESSVASSAPIAGSPLQSSNFDWANQGADYQYPIPTSYNSGYNPTHSGYPATDVFAACETPVLSPTRGQIIDLRKFDPWTAASDDPFTRGGKFVSILGFDGVRYYMAHFKDIDGDLQVGDAVVAGQVVGTVGSTGRSSACHLHFSISPNCATSEWWVRRGVVWPYPYFDAWKSGDQLSPRSEVERWSSENPNACEQSPT